MILKACHHKHGARLCLFWHHSFFMTIGANIGQWLHIVSVHLRSKESFSEDLEERFLWWKIDIVLPLRSIEAEPATLTTSKDNYTDLTNPDKLVSLCLINRFIVAWQVCSINDALWFNCIEDRFTLSFVSTITLWSCHKIAIELVDETNVKLWAFI